MITGSSRIKVKEFSEAEEISGKLAFQHLEDKFMHSVLENDKRFIEQGKLLNESVNYGVATFNPELMFEQLVANYSVAKQIYGGSFLRLVSGHDFSYIRRNINVPEFQKELKDAIAKKLNELRDEGLVDSNNNLTEKGIELASLVLYFQELDNIIPAGFFGDKMHKKSSFYGYIQDYSSYHKGKRYRDVAMKRSIKLALRRGHAAIDKKDLQVVERQSKGQAFIVYALDASGSMRGKKIEACKKAGIALAYKAINNKDKVGLIVFGSDVKIAIEPTYDFTIMLKTIASIRASRETDIVATFKKAIELFPEGNITKHLVLITDALPTKGESPEKTTLEEAYTARNHGITISLIGINLDEKGRKLAEKIVEAGQGRLYAVKDLGHIDAIVLEDYYAMG